MKGDREVEVGWFEARLPIVVRREIEDGQAWEAEAVAVNQVALGDSPHAAVRDLLGAINDLGISGRGQCDSKLLASLDTEDEDDG